MIGVSGWSAPEIVAEFPGERLVVCRNPDLAAERDCKALVPKGGLDHIPTAAQQAQNLVLLLRLAKCIRAHGVPNFPDPTSQGIRISPSSGIDLNSPAFLAAQKSCQKDSLTLGGGF